MMITINIRASVGTPTSQEGSSRCSCWITLGINIERGCLSKWTWWSEKRGGWHESLHGTCCEGNRRDPKFDLPREKGSLFFWRQSQQEKGGREESRFRYLFLVFLPQKSPVSGFLHTSLFCGSITALSSCPSDSCWDPDGYSLQNNALVWKHYTTSAPNSPCSSTALCLCKPCCFWWKSPTLLLGNPIILYDFSRKLFSPNLFGCHQGQNYRFFLSYSVDIYNFDNTLYCNHVGMVKSQSTTIPGTR